MPTYRLFAPLVNAYGQYARVQLPTPFLIERWSRARIVRLWRACTDLPKHEIEIQAECSQCLPDQNSRYAHVVTAEIDAPGTDGEAWRETHRRFDDLNDALRTAFRLASLYLNADVEPTVYFWYSGPERDPGPESGLGSGEPRHRSAGHVDRYNCEALSQFIRDTELPLTPPSVQLGLEHWEQSRQAARPDFELLSLVTALEALFNAGGQDIRYRVARSVAVLLGRDAEDSDSIFEAVSKAYDVRSKLVHTGKAKGLEAIWLHGLGRIVRDSIVRCHELQQSKEELAKQLTRLGFGDRARVTPNPSLKRRPATAATV